MELSYFISMLQYEVLKSFDFTKEFQNEVEKEGDSKIQLSINSAEIEVPIVYSTSKKETKVNDEKDEKDFKIQKTRHELPFNPSVSIWRKKDALGKFKPINKDALRKETNQSKKEVEKVEGDIIEVQVANPDMKKDDSFDPLLIGKIKLCIKPVLK